jgi:hypothetical protein
MLKRRFFKKNSEYCRYTEYALIKQKSDTYNHRIGENQNRYSVPLYKFRVLFACQKRGEQGRGVHSGANECKKQKILKHVHRTGKYVANNDAFAVS